MADEEPNARERRTFTGLDPTFGAQSAATAGKRIPAAGRSTGSVDAAAAVPDACRRLDDVRFAGADRRRDDDVDAVTAPVPGRDRDDDDDDDFCNGVDVASAPRRDDAVAAGRRCRGAGREDQLEDAAVAARRSTYVVTVRNLNRALSPVLPTILPVRRRQTRRGAAAAAATAAESCGRRRPARGKDPRLRSTAVQAD